MATTTKWGLKLMEIGQKDKTVTINDNMGILDNAPKYLGEFSSDPATTNVPNGSTYYNSTASKLKVLLSSTTWANAA